MKCHWCNSLQVKNIRKLAYWELPDGLRAIEITQIPGIHCSNCGMNYIEEQLVEQIEDQLVLIDTKKLPNSIAYDELMTMPKLLAKNYFKFD